jgi:hypothetical protein
LTACQQTLIYVVTGTVAAKDQAMTDLEILSVAPRGTQGTWAVTYAGRLLGDDRGYSSRALAIAEVHARLAKDARDAVRYERPLLYVIDPALNA